MPGWIRKLDMDEALGIETKQDQVVVRSLWGDAWRTLRRNRAAMTGAMLMAIIVLVVTVGPWFSQYAYDFTDWPNTSIGPSLGTGHFFGTDTLGRDLFVRTLYGGRISLLVGVVASVVSLLIGISYGATAGYFGGRLDAICYCPNRSDFQVPEGEVNGRKPSPGMLLAGAQMFGEAVDLADSYMIGDMTSDIGAGEAADTTTILVETGFGGKDGKVDVKADYQTANMATAVDWILSRQ